MTLWMLRHDVDISNPEAIAQHSGDPVIESGTQPESPTITLDGDDVAEAIRSDAVVWPEAEVKMYLTADPAARAARRAAESGEGDVAATEADLLRRDAIDSSRATAPLVVPEGAEHLDTTPYTLDEVIALVVARVREATA